MKSKRGQAPLKIWSLSLCLHSPCDDSFESNVRGKIHLKEKFLKSLKEFRIIYVVYSEGFPEVEAS